MHQCRGADRKEAGFGGTESRETMKKFVVTITREFGSMGRPIAKRLSELLHVEYYDRDIVEAASQKLDLPVSVISNEE